VTHHFAIKLTAFSRTAFRILVLAGESPPWFAANWDPGSAAGSARDISHRKRSEELLAKMIEISKEMVAASKHNSRPAHVMPLSEQEQGILRLFAKAESSSEIARELENTLPTLRNHITATITTSVSTR
jgi:ATP/maltotriose-dependent transcriptional regulator MalT